MSGELIGSTLLHEPLHSFLPVLRWIFAPRGFSVRVSPPILRIMTKFVFTFSHNLGTLNLFHTFSFFCSASSVSPPGNGVSSPPSKSQSMVTNVYYHFHGHLPF